MRKQLLAVPVLSAGLGQLTADARELEWIERTPSGEKRYDTDPAAGFFRRAWTGLLSTLPIDWLL